MSHGSSPAHPFTGNFKAFYDPDFTAEISTKMQVPERISVGGGESSKNTDIMVKPEKLMMHVPERILVAGGEQHIEGREPLPELRLETSLTSQLNPGVHLTTPPRVLTLDSYHYPSVDDSLRRTGKVNQDSLLSQVENRLATSSSDVVPSSGGPEDDVIVLRRQIKNLSRRILSIEQENQQRQQREVIMYAIGIVYFFLKGLIWLHRHW